MATQKSTVELIFQGVDKTSEATQSALRNAQSFTGSLQNVTAPIADFTKSAVKLQSSLLAAGAAITTFAIVAAGDFDSAFREISTLIDRPIEDLEDFRRAILDYAQTSTQPLEQITQAIYSAISAGADYADAIAAVAQAEQLAIAGKAGLNDSLVVLVSSLNAYGLGMDQAERFSDALFTAVKNGQTTLPELSAALSRVTGAAATLEVPFETLLSSISALTSTGMPTNQAVTAINAALMSMIAPSTEAKNIAAELGIEFDANAVKSKGLEAVFRDVAKATGGNEEQMRKLFGSTEALKAVLPLTGVAAQKFNADLESMRDNSGATSQAFDKMADGISQVNQAIANALRGTLIEIGTPLLEEYGSVARAITAIFNAIGRDVRDGQLGGLVDFIRGMLAETASVLSNIAINLPEALNLADLSGIQRGIEVFTGSIRDLFSVFDLGSPEGLARALEALADSFAVLSEFSAGAVRSLQWLFDAMASADSDILKNAKEWAGLAGEISGFMTQLDVVLPKVGSLLGMLEVLVGLMVTKGALSIAGAAAAAAGGVSILAAALGPALLAGAAAASTLKLGQLVSILIDWKKETDALTESTHMNEKAQSDLQSRIGQLSDELGFHIRDQKHLQQLWRDGVLVANEAGDGWVIANAKISSSANEVEKEVDAATFATQVFNLEQGKVLDAAGNWVDIANGATQTAEETKRADDAARGYRKTVVDGVTVYEQVGRAASDAYGKAADAADDAIKKSETFQTKMLELASNERIKAMEFKVQFDIAQFEAETKRVEAAFKSIDSTINSTGDLLGSLFGDLGKADRLTQLAIERQVKKENERRDQALKLQKDLTEAQIDALKARTKTMNRGDSLIKIDGAGLQPHLEGFMWEILRTIQVRVNEDGLDMLLGVNN